MALPISIARRRTDIGTGWDGRIDEMAADLALIEKTTQKFTYDFAVNGGTAGTSIQLGDIPINAVITDMWYDVITPVASATTPAVTVALEIETDAAGGAAPVAAIAANDGSNVWAAAGLKGTTVDCWADASGALTDIVEAASRAATFVKTTGSHAVQLTVGGATPADDLTAGRVLIYVSYFISA